MTYAGTNEIHRYGRHAQDGVREYMEPNANGFYSIPVSTKAWTLGTSEGKFGRFMRFGSTCFSVNKGGYAWAKVGTEKAEAFVQMLNTLLNQMVEIDTSRRQYDEEEEEA